MRAATLAAETVKAAGAAVAGGSAASAGVSLEMWGAIDPYHVAGAAIGTAAYLLRLAWSAPPSVATPRGVGKLLALMGFCFLFGAGFAPVLPALPMIGSALGEVPPVNLAFGTAFFAIFLSRELPTVLRDRVRRKASKGSSSE